MNQLFGGSICVTDLLDKAKEGHSAFSKAQNGKVYCNVLIWLNEEFDKFGNKMSIQLSSSKEMRDKEEKKYIGNAKPIESNQPVNARDVDADFSNIPERKEKSLLETMHDQYSGKQPEDDLPF